MLARRTLLIPAIAIGLLIGCARPAAGPPITSTPTSVAQPYAGWQDRPIRALAPERIDDLLAGRGAGYALAAELNHYPGPIHVLEAGPNLGLRPDQERSTRAIYNEMQQRAREQGRQLVDLEAELDAAFRSGQVTPADLDRLTARIAEVEGALRATHLAAHLRMKDILTPDQVARYDQLRGYAAPSLGAAPGPDHSAGGHHDGMTKHG